MHFGVFLLFHMLSNQFQVKENYLNTKQVFQF